MESAERAGDIERLQDLVAGMDDIKEFLDGMTVLAAAVLSRVSGSRVDCAVTLHRHKRSATIAGSSEDAILLDGIEHSLDEGPRLEAVRTGEPVLLADVSAEPRWPEYRRELADKGCRSALGVPLELGENAVAVLVFFAPVSGLFTGETIREASGFAAIAGRALRLGIRIAATELRADDLAAALETRTSIDLARGIIMAQNRCSQDEAFKILKKVSSNRNCKLHDVAEEIISGFSETGTTTHFDA